MTSHTILLTTACSFTKKIFQHGCFPVKVAKFFRAPIFTKHSKWLLLYEVSSVQFADFFHLLTFTGEHSVTDSFNLALVEKVRHQTLETKSQVTPDIFMITRCNTKANSINSYTVLCVRAIEAPHWHQWLRSGVFVFNFQSIIYIALLLIFLMSQSRLLLPRFWVFWRAILLFCDIKLSTVKLLGLKRTLVNQNLHYLHPG